MSGFNSIVARLFGHCGYDYRPVANSWLSFGGRKHIGNGPECAVGSAVQYIDCDPPFIVEDGEGGGIIPTCNAHSSLILGATMNVTSKKPLFSSNISKLYRSAWLNVDGVVDD